MVSFSQAFKALAVPVQVKHFSELPQEARTNIVAMLPRIKNFFIKIDFSFSKVTKEKRERPSVNKFNTIARAIAFGPARGLLYKASSPQGFSNVNGSNFGGKGNKKSNAAYGIGNGEQFAGLCAGSKISITYGGHGHGTEIKAVNP
jgi:hypothetical protein